MFLVTYWFDKVPHLPVGPFRCSFAILLFLMVEILRNYLLPFPVAASFGNDVALVGFLMLLFLKR